MFFSGFKKVNAYQMLLAGRFVIGFSCGSISGLAPLYLSEISPVDLRGSIGALNQFAVVTGILISYVLGLNSILGTSDHWNWLLASIVIPAILQLVIMPFCPESPYFLVINKQRNEKARKELFRLRGHIYVDDEIRDMVEEYERSRRSPTVTFSQLITGYRRIPLLISIVMQLSQQFCGINAVMFFSTDIFEESINSQTIAQYATILIGAMQVISTGISTILMDKVGRRTLHLYGLGGMFIFCLTFTTGNLWNHSGVSSLSWSGYISVISLFLYTFSFGIGPGAIPWLIVPELFSQDSRGVTVSISVFVNWLAQFVIGLCFLSVQSFLKDYTFIPFAIFLVFFWFFTYYWLPETKGHTFEEITELFQNQFRASQTRNSRHSLICCGNVERESAHRAIVNEDVANERTPLIL